MAWMPSTCQTPLLYPPSVRDSWPTPQDPSATSENCAQAIRHLSRGSRPSCGPLPISLPRPRILNRSFSASSRLWSSNKTSANFSRALADERKHHREELLAATEKELEKILVAKSRKRSPLRGKDQIGIREGKVLGRSKVGKHFQLVIREGEYHY